MIINTEDQDGEADENADYYGEEDYYDEEYPGGEEYEQNFRNLKPPQIQQFLQQQ
jgi:hypothetical protein